PSSRHRPIRRVVEHAGRGASQRQPRCGLCAGRVLLQGVPGYRWHTQRASAEVPDNSFRTSFVVFPGSSSSQLLRISVADSASDFGVFLALQAEADARAKGSSGLPAFQKYVTGGRKDLPANFNNIVGGLAPLGYAPILSL